MICGVLMKAQSGMEYMITYGWALLAVAVVVVVLWQIGVFKPFNLFTYETATGFVKITVSNQFFKSYANGSGSLTLVYSSRSANNITITNFQVTDQNNNLISPNNSSFAIVVVPGSSVTSTFDYSGSNLGASSGGSFAKSVTITYNEGTLNSKLDSGNIQGKYS